MNVSNAKHGDGQWHNRIVDHSNDDNDFDEEQQQRVFAKHSFYTWKGRRCG